MKKGTTVLVLTIRVPCTYNEKKDTLKLLKSKVKNDIRKEDIFNAWKMTSELELIEMFDEE